MNFGAIVIVSVLLGYGEYLYFCKAIMPLAYHSLTLTVSCNTSISVGYFISASQQVASIIIWPE